MLIFWEEFDYFQKNSSLTYGRFNSIQMYWLVTSYNYTFIIYEFITYRYIDRQCYILFTYHEK